MAAQQRHLVILVTILMASVLHAAVSAATTQANTTEDAGGSAYDVLQQNNLPRGLLPLGVKSYVLKPDGTLEVTLPKECNFFITVGGTKLQFRYGTSVSGVIKSGSISRVSGVRFQVKFAWLGINQVSHTGDQINLQVESSTKSFPASAFYQSANCN